MDSIELLLEYGWNIGKCLQLYVAEKPSLVIGPFSSFHNNLFEEVLKKHSIPFRKKFIGAFFSPAPVGHDYYLAGAGRASILPEEDILLYGMSTGYEKGIDKKHAEEISDLTGIRIIFK